MTLSDAVTGVLRSALERGETVEIEGLGTFLRSKDGTYHFTPQSQPQVFVAYVAEDIEPARRLCDALRTAGCSPWLDKDKLIAGQDWTRAIERAIEISDVFVACFSPRSIHKRSQFQSELRCALRNARRLPLDATFLIPVRLERCPIPRRLSDRTQYLDLFPDWERGMRRLVQSIHTALRQTAPVRSRLVVR